MYKSKILLLLLLPCFLMSAVSFANENNQTGTTDTAKQYVTDATITTKVKSGLLMDKKIKSLSISVATSNGVVTLTGIVNSAMQKERAIRIAKHTKGVKKIKDELIINAIEEKNNKKYYRDRI